MLKKLLSIFLLALLLFNIAGYRLVFALLENKATEQLDAAIDTGNYSEEDLIEIRVPLNMPYQDRLTEFERHYGEVIVDGKVYTYVKMKVDRDMLVLKCIPNIGRQQIKNDANNLVKSSSGQDMENTGKKHGSSFSKVFSFDYDDKSASWNLQPNEMPKNLFGKDFAAALLDVLIKIPHQPPRC